MKLNSLKKFKDHPSVHGLYRGRGEKRQRWKETQKMREGEKGEGGEKMEGSVMLAYL